MREKPGLFYEPQLFLQTFVDGKPPNRWAFSRDEEAQIRGIVASPEAGSSVTSAESEQRAQVPSNRNWGPWLTRLSDNRFFRNEYFNVEPQPTAKNERNPHWLEFTTNVLRQATRSPERVRIDSAMLSPSGEAALELLNPVAYLAFEDRRLGGELAANWRCIGG